MKLKAQGLQHLAPLCRAHPDQDFAESPFFFLLKAQGLADLLGRNGKLVLEDLTDTLPRAGHG